ncbi:MAG: ribosome maturation factor RimP [Longimicrobiales bacterium]
MDRAKLEQLVESHVESLGYELVEFEQAGSKTRPLLRLRIDRPDSQPGQGVTIDDCSRVSRAIEHYLEAEGEVGERYVLEVSSPGIERPLHRRRDFERFAGREVAVKTQTPVGMHGKRIEGVLRGVRDARNGEEVEIELANAERVSIPRHDIVRAHLVFRWEE